MIDKSINFHDVLEITNCKFIEDETVILGKGKTRTPCRTITICQDYDGNSVRTVLNLFGQNGQDTVPMKV
jgi:hypothetical protein